METECLRGHVLDPEGARGAGCRSLRNTTRQFSRIRRGYRGYLSAVPGRTGRWGCAGCASCARGPAASAACRPLRGRHRERYQSTRQKREPTRIDREHAYSALRTPPDGRALARRDPTLTFVLLCWISSRRCCPAFLIRIRLRNNASLLALTTGNIG